MFDRIRKKPRASPKPKASTSSLPNSVPSIVIQNHLPTSQALADLTNTPRKRKSRVPASTDSDESDEEFFLPYPDIATVLADLHKSYPAFNFPSYEAALKGKGIMYANSAVDFDRDYYQKLGLADGAIGPFLAYCKKVVKRVRKTSRKKKLARVDSNDA